MLKVIGFCGTAAWVAAAALQAADLANEVRRAELAFAESARERDLESFLGFIHPQARFLGSGGEAAVGPEGVAAAWAAFFRPEGPSIDWRPERVEVNEELGLGFSTGPYEITSPDGSRSVGTFFSVWRRGDGGWKVLFDGGTVPTRVESEEPEADEVPGSGSR